MKKINAFAALVLITGIALPLFINAPKAEALVRQVCNNNAFVPDNIGRSGTTGPDGGSSEFRTPSAYCSSIGSSFSGRSVTVCNDRTTIVPQNEIVNGNPRTFCANAGGYTQAASGQQGNATASDENCPGGRFLGFPTWYRYLGSVRQTDAATGQPTCTPRIQGIEDTWLIAAAIIEMLTRLAGMVAIGFVIYGGITYVQSQGAPDKTKQAQQTIINALIGLVIAIAATGMVTFIAGRF